MPRLQRLHPEPPTPQFQLLPTQRPSPRAAEIPVAGCHASPAFPEAEFVQNIADIGLIHPIAVIQRAPRTHQYDVAAGRRRLAAVRQLGWESMPAWVFPPGTSRHVAAAIALAENTHRRPNPLTDLLAIEEMVNAGASVEIIAEQLHLPVNVVRSRMRLAGLIPEMRARLEHGSISPGTAMVVARLPAALQEHLDAEAGEGRVVAAAVRAATATAVQEQVIALPNAAFAPTPAPAQVIEVRLADVETAASWPVVIQCLNAAQRAIPAAADDSSDEMYALIGEAISRCERIAGTLRQPVTPRRRVARAR